MNAKTIMIQGTASNAGKTLIAAGLCRLFKQDGYRAAPFKSQNMALNSFVTKEGFEMGRGQVVQAEAAGIDPSVDMNPILLKPTGDRHSQVIVQGEVWRDMDAKEYYKCKKTFLPKVMESFERLSSKYDIIVLEGAGSPAEINLRENDIVNMAMAKAAGAPVLLAGDIDRGGVFAALAGTMMLLTGDERRYVKGLLINKFRGDKSLLESGLVQLEEITHRPVLGVIPWVKLDIDDEDSLSERLVVSRGSSAAGMEAVVVRLPHISNFTDFNTLSRFINLRYIDSVPALKNAGLVILPGTKNTIDDLSWLFKTGLADEIKGISARGTPVIGICGGYQMLGRTLSDPYGAEGKAGSVVDGLGLLPVDTVFKTDKTRTQVTGRIASLSGPLAALSGLPVEGYEIHLGDSVFDTANAAPFSSLVDRTHGQTKNDGCHRGNVYGTYVHGIFDSPETAAALSKALGNTTALPQDGEKAAFDIRSYKESQYDKLADHLRANIDMKRIYQIIGEGV
ncbi:MAG: cobyric acid synthase [Treponema sp.]|jgi:adenosylcobyric acid synthase|nr:cobyric acid synthase [Treponema sp.]